MKIYRQLVIIPIAVFAMMFYPNTVSAYPAGYSTADRCDKKSSAFNQDASDAYQKMYKEAESTYNGIREIANEKLKKETDACNLVVFTTEIDPPQADPQYKVWKENLEACRKKAFDTFTVTTDEANKPFVKANSEAYQTYCWPESAGGKSIGQKTVNSCAAPLIAQAKKEYNTTIKTATTVLQQAKKDALLTYKIALKKKNAKITKEAKAAYNNALKNINKSYKESLAAAKTSYNEAVKTAKNSCQNIPSN